MIRKFIIVLILMGCVLGTGTAGAEVPLSDYNALRDVSVGQDGDDLLIRFEFKKPVRQRVEPQFYKRSVQLDFNLTYVDPPKRYFPVESGPVSQVYVSQFDKELMRVRFMLEKENGVRSRHFRVQTEDRYLNVRIKKNAAPGYDEALDRLLERAVGADAVLSQPVQNSTPDPSLETVNKVLKRVRPSERLQEAPEPEEGFSEEAVLPTTRTPLVLRDREPGSVLSDSSKSKGASNNLFRPGSESEPDTGGESLWGTAVKMISTLAFVVGLMFLIFHGFKKWVMKQGMFGGGEKPIRVISTGFLGPKKSIALVEVAGRVLVLGVANDQISLLSSLEEGEELDRILQNSRKGKTTPVHRENADTSRSAAAPARESSENGVDVYTRTRKPVPKTAPNAAAGFSDIVQQYSDLNPKPKQSVASIKRLIQQRMDQIKAGV